jgi:hypothetical protein
VLTTFRQKMSLKDATFSPSATYLPRGGYTPFHSTANSAVRNSHIRIYKAQHLGNVIPTISDISAQDSRKKLLGLVHIEIISIHKEYAALTSPTFRTCILPIKLYFSLTRNRICSSLDFESQLTGASYFSHNAV